MSTAVKEEVFERAKSLIAIQNTKNAKTSDGIEFGDCPDCGVKPGQPHVSGCDIEQCSSCGLQRISCSCGGRHDRAFARWTGIWPGLLEAFVFGVDLNAFYGQRLHEIFLVKPKSK
jgi:hypothetical protein